jgi:hypothetical protein
MTRRSRTPTATKSPTDMLVAFRTRDICLAEAGANSIAKADAEAAQEHGEGSRRRGVVHAQAMTTCQGKSATTWQATQDVCEGGKGRMVKGKADAGRPCRFRYNREAATTQADARKDANVEQTRGRI